MEHIARVLALSIFAICVIPAPLSAQDVPASTVPEVRSLGPVDPGVSGTGDVLAEGLTASSNGYEDKIHLTWEIRQQCLFGGQLTYWLYEDGVQIFTQTYSGVAYQAGYSYSWDRYFPPNTTRHYTLKRTSSGTLCNVTANFYATGKTDVIRKPVGLDVVNTDSSDRDIEMRWSNGSSLPTYTYTIFKDGAEFTSTGDTSYTVHTVPGEQATWGVAANTSHGQSQRTEKLGSTAPFISPIGLTASVDTTVGYVRVSWECASDYATHFVVYRDDTALDTIPVSEKQYLDVAAVPRGARYYEYRVTSYNAPSGMSSAPSNDAVGRPAYMTASDGTESAQVHVQWTHFPDTVRGSAWTDLRLYRDSVEIVPVSAGSVEKWDLAASPGKLHRYRLDVVNVNDVLLTIVDYGFTPANGLVSGWVRTTTGAGVNAIEVRAYSAAEFSRLALSLGGYGDCMIAPPLNLNSNTVTMSAWIRREGAQADWSGILFSRDGRTAAGLCLMSDGELRYSWNDDPSAYGWSSGLIVPETVWTFVALIVGPDRATLLLDDTSVTRIAAHAPEEFDGAFLVGGDPADTSRYFRGRVDNVSVWRSARTVDKLLDDRHRLLHGSESGLVAAWNFNDDQDSAAGDFAVGGNHHGLFRGGATRVGESPQFWHYGVSVSDGQYTIPRINWENELEFTVKPFREGHGFKGASFPADSQVLNFTDVSYEHTGINFLDTTSIGISGAVRTDGDPACPVPGVKIMVDSIFTGVITDSAGTYSISVSEPGEYTLSLGYGTHGFLPADTTIDVQNPVLDLDFLDTTRSVLSGTVGGSCDNFLGVARVRIRSTGTACLDTTVQTDASGFYGLTLPARMYTVGLVQIAHPDSITIINAFTVDTIDLTEADTVFDFLYHPPPETRVSEMPSPGCEPYDVPILTQEVTYDMRIDVIEAFGGLECPVDSGSVTISDYAGYAYRETTITLENGFAYYPLTAGYPNITGGGAHPYQKMIALRTVVGDYTAYDTLWVLVQGQKPREFQFSTVSPEIPLMILRDPPGDMSYSYLSSATTTSVNVGFSFEATVGVGAYAKFRVGGGLDIPGIGPVGVWGAGQAEASVGLRSTLNGTQEIRITASEMLKTSDAEAITGPEGDVFMGAALNLLYAKTDIVEYDPDSCRILRDTGIVWNGDGFRTTYLYTQSHIEHNVIPGLEAMAAILNSSGDPVRMDSAEILLNQADVWRQVIEFNDSIKQHAVAVPEFPDNVSFSAGASLSEEASVTSATTLSIGLNLFIDASVALSAGAKQGEFNEVEGGVKIFSRLDIGATLGAGYEVTNTVGFTLADDDVAPPGDAFWVDIKGDPVYGTPVFGLLSGQSSCPWEHPTLPREGVGITMNTFVMNDVPAAEPALFDLYLSNLGQNDETRTYLLSMIPASNPDGAVIKVGGAVLGDDEFEYPLPPNPDSALRVQLRVERDAGGVYDYEGLQLHLSSPCDGQIDTAVSFSVHFTKPCSDIGIVQPSANWILNHNQNRQMTVVLKDYDAGNTDMQLVRFEYRPMGAAGWTTLFSIPRGSLPADSIGYPWDLSGLAEGPYELRASTECTNGTYITRIHGGMYDCTLPASSGTPQPSDGYLDPGDQISVQFTENINCLSSGDTALTVMNVTRGEEVEVQIQCGGDELVLTPVNGDDLQIGDSVVVTISAFSDPFGNHEAQPVTWSFIVNIATAVPGETPAEVPSEFVLYQSYPNPFNPDMTIRFGLPRATDVSLAIFDIGGREVMMVAQGMMPAGYHERNVAAGHLSSGIYFYRLKTPEFQAVRKMVLMK